MKAKKIKIYKYVLLLFIATVLTSCDYLDVKPNDIITEDKFWTTANGAAFEQYCNGYYP